jgi:hypothetical protein
MYSLKPASSRILVAISACLITAGYCKATAGAPKQSVTILLTADTEGHAMPCHGCTTERGWGGLARRATLVAQQREENPSLLLVDAGNAIFGGESLASGGEVIASAYNALGYDAVNVCFRDFRRGKAATRALVKEARFAAISANLLDDEDGKLLLRPYIVKEVGGKRIAVIGATQEPAGLEALPHLQKQLAGILIQSPVEALDKWLPKAKAEADKVILLYYGSASGVAPIREKFGGDLDAILVGSVPPDLLPQDTETPLVGAWSHGRQVAQVRLVPSGEETEVEASQLPVKPTLKPDSDMEHVLARYLKPITKARNEMPAKGEPTPASTLPASRELDQTYPLHSEKRTALPRGAADGLSQQSVIATVKDNEVDVSKIRSEAIRQAQESEPNDDVETADEIELNVRVAGRINERGDWDHYVIRIPTPGVETFVVQLSGFPKVRWSLELLDADGNELDHSRFADTGEGEEIVKMKFKPGTYYLAVSVESGKKRGAEYTLYVGGPPKPPATAKEVKQALGKALDFLASKQQTDGSWSRYEEGNTGLCLMAFVGAMCVGKDYSPNIRAATNYLKSQYRPSSDYPQGSEDADCYGGRLGEGDMYQHAIATLALAEALVALNDDSLEPIVQDAISLIIRSQNTDRKPETLGGPIRSDSRHHGGWRYEPESTDSDISVTGWQILALRAAVNAGFSVPDHTFPAAAGFVRSLQGKDDGSFLYDAPEEEGDSCARAGMGALSLQLCGLPQDPAIQPALRFMQDFAPRWNTEGRGDGYAFYYWYYGTRAMYLSGGDNWRIWKDWICRFLVDHQDQDGSWRGTRKEEELDIYRVALGALMLEFCCGHVPMYMSPVKRRQRGSVEVVFAEGAASQPAKNVELILDASFSMWGKIGSTNKISVARQVLEQVIRKLPDNVHVGLRVFGHRYGQEDRRTNTDTELMLPIGPMDKGRLVGTINQINPKGKTPLVYSILQAQSDFQKPRKGTLVVVTDGQETCGGDINSIAPALKRSGLDLRVNIVGFGIEELGARRQLEAIAKSTAGRYLDAGNPEELLASLEETLHVEFVVVDQEGTEQAKGFVGGDPVEVLEGDHTLRLLLEPEPLEVRVVVEPQKTSRLVLDKSQGRWIARAE